MTTPSAAQSPHPFAAALDAQWDFGKPAISEQRFRAELARWPADSAEAHEARTQVARSLGLQRKFAEANALLDSGDAQAALDYWQRALSARATMGNAASTRMAKWTVARGYRAVGRLQDAETMQKALLDEFDSIGETDGYVYEELMEIALARGDAKAAQPWAVKAHATLKDDPDLAANEAPRLARLAAIAMGNSSPPAKP